MMNSIHVPVMVQEIIDHLIVGSGGLYVDCTLGMGGHASRILMADPKSQLYGIDLDPQAIELAKENLKDFGDRVFFIHGNFAELHELLAQHGISQVDGVLMDLGVSSFQLDTPERGFSFRLPDKLDMRMDPTEGQPISYEINKESADKLATIIREFGEERWAKKIAKSIIMAREKKPITTTTQLAEIIERSVPWSGSSIHPATRTFQALRIYKNSELDNLKNGLEQAIPILKPGDRICVISFHSLEDRIVKHTFRTLERGCICPSDIPKCICGKIPVIKVVTKQPITPKDEEVKANPRSRSSKMRVAIKI